MKSLRIKKEHSLLVIERSGEEGSEWLTSPCEGLIQTRRRLYRVQYKRHELVEHKPLALQSH